MASAHPLARLLPGQALGQPRVGVRGIVSDPGFKPRGEVFSAIDNAASELAINRPITA